MGGPTNTQPRYRPPPPGTAPPPPPPGDGGGAPMGGHAPTQPQQQFQQPQQSYYAQPPQPPPQQSYYAQQQQQPPPQQSYYGQQPQQPQQPPPQQPPQPSPSRTAIPGSNQSYAARSAAAHTPHGSQHSSPHSSQHGGPTPIANQGGVQPANGTGGGSSKPKPKSSSAESPAVAAEQSRLLNSATQKVTEAAYHMQRAMENDDPVSALEKACLMLEELGDPNHGLHHRGGRGGPGGGGNTPYGPPPSYYSSGGAVPPLGNYGDRPYPNYGGNYGGGYGGSNPNHGFVTPLTPKNYYELHMRAMDEMPSLEEYLLGLCYVPSAAGIEGGPTNYQGHANSIGSAYNAAPFTTEILYETVQYCPRVVPRLYLQICMGAVSIRSGARLAVDIMEELGEAAKCVQCPVRGLFLRYYLLMALKDKLPDGTLDEGEIEEVNEGAGDAVDEGPLIGAPLESGEDPMQMSGTSEPTSPPPALPPPPPPSTDREDLFPETNASDSLFGDSSAKDALFPKSGPSEGDSLFSDTPLTPKSAAVTANEDFSKAAATANESVSSAAVTTKHTNVTQSSVRKERDPNEPRVGTVVDSYEFILNNLIEMNRLWIRIQHMPGDKTKETKRRRERERNELRILVGSNLNRLSQLEGATAHEYGSKILPRILEEVSSCRDPLAQAYLMDCVVQAFPDEFHLETLEVFLGVCPKLREKVNVRTILSNMMERLLHYYQEEKLVNDEEDTNNVKLMMAMQSFDMFESCVQRVFEARGLNIPPKDIIRLQGCLLNYALKIAPNNTEMIMRCISQCAKALGTLQEQKRASMMGQGVVLGGGTKRSLEIDMEEVATTELEKLLSVPLESMGLKVLDMPEFAMLLAFLPWENRRKVAVSMIESIIMGGEDKTVKDANELEQLFTILAPLLRDEGMAAPAAMYEQEDHSGGSLISRTANLMGTLGISPSLEHDELFGGPGNLGGFHKAQSFHGDAQKIKQFREEQTLVAKLVHVLEGNEDTDVAYQMLNVARRHIQPGGAMRVAITFPPVVFAALGLLKRVQAQEFPEPSIPSPVPTKEGNPKEEETSAEEGGKEDTEEATEESKEEPAAEETSTGGNEEEEKVAADDSAKEADGDAEKAKEEPVKTESNPLPKDEPSQLFPEFTKSVNCRKVLVFLQKSVAILAPSNPELAFRLYLEISVATDLLAHSTKQHHSNASAEFSSIAYDFMTQAFLVYEDEISESNAQVRAITTIVGSLLACKTFEGTDYEALITKTAQYAAKLLKKPDQCRMVCLCSRLFYVVGDGKDDATVYRNPQRVLECLQRGLKIADACSMTSSANVQLFVEILDYYVYYYDIENPVITDKFLSGLVALINEHFDSTGTSGSSAVSEARAHYQHILDRIRRKKTEEGTKERYEPIVS